MLSNVSKLIIFLFINGFIRINAQELLRKEGKTFANTQFDLDPNLPFDGYVRITTNSPDVSQLKSHLSVKVCF